MKKVPVFKYKKLVSYALVDDEDYEKVAPYKWTLNTKGYVKRHINLESRSEAKLAGRSNRKGQTIFMHRVIMGLGSYKENPVQVDHFNWDKLDNRRSNLRVVTGSENVYNSPKRKGTSSKYKNVCWVKRDQKWQAQVSIKGRKIALGHYDNEIDAANAAAKWRKENITINEEGLPYLSE